MSQNVLFLGGAEMWEIKSAFPVEGEGRSDFSCKLFLISAKLFTSLFKACLISTVSFLILLQSQPVSIQDFYWIPYVLI